MLVRPIQSGQTVKEGPHSRYIWGCWCRVAFAEVVVPHGFAILRPAGGSVFSELADSLRAAASEL